jgi:1-deoxy-D-xylulose-5-phosphate reductoisomerase
MAAVLNAANEVAVEAFLARRIGFRDIHRIIEKTMNSHSSTYPRDVEAVLEVDGWARRRAESLID